MSETPLALLHLPGGPYRLTVIEPEIGPRRLRAAEMCPCAGDPHWHELCEADRLCDLVALLATHHVLAQVEVTP